VALAAERVADHAARSPSAAAGIHPLQQAPPPSRRGGYGAGSSITSRMPTSV
jgi:hypothetical protein